MVIQVVVIQVVVIQVVVIQIEWSLEKKVRHGGDYIYIIVPIL